MSHELRENKTRRRELTYAIPDDGEAIQDFIVRIMAEGYSKAGALKFIDDLRTMKLIYEKGGRVYRR